MERIRQIVETIKKLSECRSMKKGNKERGLN